jgi:multicomponent Na+:H+ antiporter subunit D
MMKIWTATFWGEPEGQLHPDLGRDRSMVAVTLVLAGLSVVIGLAAPPLFAYSERAAAGLLAGDAYVSAVLGTGQIALPHGLQQEILQ